MWRYSYSISRRRQIIILTKLWKVKPFIRSHFEVFFVFLFCLVKLVYWISVLLILKISFFWKSQNHIPVNIESFSSNVLESFSLIISLSFKIIFHEVHWSSSVMIIWHGKGVRRVNEGMFNVSWTQIASVVSCVLLQGVSEGGLVHVWARSLVALPSPFIERIMVFNFELIVVGEWIRCSISWLNNAVWRIHKVVNLVFYIISVIIAKRLSFTQIVLLNVFYNFLSFSIDLMVSSLTESRGMCISKFLSLVIGLVNFIGDSFLLENLVPELGIIVPSHLAGVLKSHFLTSLFFILFLIKKRIKLF